MKNQHPVVHFEMPYKDAARVTEFYETAFGWNMNRFGEDMGNYIMARTTETDENNMIKTPGAINGGFYPKRPDAPQPGIVISVDDIQSAMQKVREASGKVFGEPIDIPNVGLYIAFSDTEGNFASMLQPKK
ncbi:MAG: VOC family protein [Candidatus Moraniibacteriota bacterium]|nr:MAG: VOC family protein [Candidatus Moranbacteria bacterium]